MHENTIFPLASIFFLGLGSQWLAWKLRLPAIVTLIATGLIAGPVTGFLNPDELLGQFLQPMVALSVAIILFEGGLSLRFSDLTESGTHKSVRRLVFFGSLITWTLLTGLAMKLLGFRFELALLLGAILVVTGPTVILPLLRQVGLGGRVGTILKWEGMVNDPLGAVLAVVVFEAIRGGEIRDFESIALLGLGKTIFMTLVGAGVFAAAFLFCLRRFWIPDHLQAPLALALALLLFGVCDLVQPESGLAAVTLLGLFVSHDQTISLKHIRGFKENLSVVLISSLFVILSARIEWEALTSLKLKWFIFVALAVLIVRPIAVFVSTMKSGLSWKEKAFLAAVGPRGIVAAAIASVFALDLRESNYPGAENLMIITFLVIVGSVVVSGLVATPLARALDLARKGKGNLLIVGAHERSRYFAEALQEAGVPVLLVDTNSNNVRLAREKNLDALQGDILSSELEERLEFSEIGALLALLTNDEVNTLAVLKYQHVLGRANLFRVVPDQDTNPETGRTFAGLTREELRATWEKGERPQVVVVGPDCQPTRPLVVIGDEGDWEVVDRDREFAEGEKVLALVPQ
jgi:NhaP-type Na+/H+ or K+/H+ antiporter